TSNSVTVQWDGAIVLAVSDNFNGAFTHYSFNVTGDASLSSTPLLITYGDGDGTGINVDQITVQPQTGPATESTSGSVSFSDETTDTHTASFLAQGGGYVGTFSLDPVSESAGSGSVGWHFSVDNADIQFLADGQVLDQTYSVTITDDHGASTTQDVTGSRIGTNGAPTPANDTV